MPPQSLLVLVFVLLFQLGKVYAQEPASTGYRPPPPPPIPVCRCPPAPPPTPPPVRLQRPWDLGIRGIDFNARAVVTDGAKTYVLVYAAQFPAAALIDVATGLAQIDYPFYAGVGPDEKGRRIAFDQVQVLSPQTFLWWHHGAAWSAHWNDSLPWQPMPGFSWR